MSAPIRLCNPGAPPCGPLVVIGIPGGFSEWWMLTWNWLKAFCSCGRDPAGQTCGPIGDPLTRRADDEVLVWGDVWHVRIGEARPGERYERQRADDDDGKQKNANLHALPPFLLPWRPRA